MKHTKLIWVCVGAGIVCLLLGGILRPWAIAQGTVQASGEGKGNGELFLPVVMKPFPFTTSRISISSDGVQGNNSSGGGSISADGRYVAFGSNASNLVIGDTNNYSDIFIRDRQTEQTSRISVASDGTQGNADIGGGTISADGRYVAFFTTASNLVSNDTNGSDEDVFVHDRLTGQTRLVSVASDGTQGNDRSGGSWISADGRYVGFRSFASNLVSNDTNGVWDVFVHDLQTGQTSRVSIASDGTQGNSRSEEFSISADGRYVTFASTASTLVSNDTNGHRDIFIRDRQMEQTSLISVASDGTQGDDDSGYPSISADGRYVIFSSRATNLVSGDTNGIPDVFIHDQQTGQTSRLPIPSDGIDYMYRLISGNGRYVLFSSYTNNPVLGDTNGDWDAFVYDLQTEQTSLVSIASDGMQGNGGSTGGSISSDGHFITFSSSASNLVNGDTNNTSDGFVHDRGE